MQFGPLSLPLLVLFTSFAVGLRSSSVDHVVLERRSYGSSWVRRGRVASDLRVPVRIGLASLATNRESGQEYLMDIANPLSPNYGKHWTFDKVNNHFSPSEESLNATLTWLEESGIAVSRVWQNRNKGFLNFGATIGELEKLLKADYHMYEHLNADRPMIACEQYHVPKHLKHSIDFITPGIGSPVAAHSKKRPNSLRKRDDSLPLTCLPPPTSQNFTLDQCADGLFPECIRALYGIPETPTHADNNIFAIFQANASYIQTDMDQFFEQVFPKIPTGTHSNDVFLNGAPPLKNFSDGYSPTVAGEPDLDLQLAWPLTYPENITSYDALPTLEQIGGALGSNSSDPLQLGLNLALDDVLSSFDGSHCYNSTDSPCGVYQPPTVLSISYASQELQVSEAVSKRICNEALKLGLQGTTILIASGDGGPATFGDECYGPTNSTFEPNGLAACPWVTAVGSTKISRSNISSTSFTEIVASDSNPTANYSSSGGFSNYFSLPIYQEAAVSRYFYENPSPYPTYNYNGSLSSVGVDGGRFNRFGRGIPDVAAVGQNITCVLDGCLNNQGGGTSAATPIFASVIWRINGERMAAGKNPVGFINPALYANPEMLNDVVEGNNPGCNSNGFEAVSGWDPATGLGTPNYDRMRAYFMSLP